MKISEMTNDQASDAMIRISAALAVVFEDKEVLDVMKSAGELEGKSILEGLSLFLPKVTTLLFRKHRNSLYEIVGALEQKDKDTVGKMNFRDTAKSIMENWETIRDFFPSSGTVTETNGN